MRPSTRVTFTWTWLDANSQKPTCFWNLTANKGNGRRRRVRSHPPSLWLFSPKAAHTIRKWVAQAVQPPGRAYFLISTSDMATEHYHQGRSSRDKARAHRSLFLRAATGSNQGAYFTPRRHLTGPTPQGSSTAAEQSCGPFPFVLLQTGALLLSSCSSSTAICWFG